MPTEGLEPDGSYQIMQDESCGHVLFNPPNQPNLYVWDNDPARQFLSEAEAMDWHEINCPIRGQQPQS